MRVRIDIQTSPSYLSENPNELERDLSIVLSSKPPSVGRPRDHLGEFRDEIEKKFQLALDYIFERREDENSNRSAEAS